MTGDLLLNGQPQPEPDFCQEYLDQIHRLIFQSYREILQLREAVDQAERADPIRVSGQAPPQIELRGRSQ
jgi:hypothetical protein